MGIKHRAVSGFRKFGLLASFQLSASKSPTSHNQAVRSHYKK